MRKKSLIFTASIGLFFLSASSYAGCVDLPGLWHCFSKDDPSRVSTGDCKNLECPDGCVEIPNGTHGHCCSKPAGTDCRRRVLSDGCVKREKIDCLPTQFCNDQGKCQDILSATEAENT